MLFFYLKGIEICEPYVLLQVLSIELDRIWLWGQPAFGDLLSHLTHKQKNSLDKITSIPIAIYSALVTHSEAYPAIKSFSWT